MEQDYFSEKPVCSPQIYAYFDDNPHYAGFLKVGYTSIDADKRVAQQYPTKRPDGSKPYKIVLVESAMYPDGSSFMDHDVHAVLKKQGFKNVGGEWFECTVEDVKKAIVIVRNHLDVSVKRDEDFKMRPEQKEAVEKTEEYFNKEKARDPKSSPKFLWNAKMRFGKTFATYELAKKMGFKRILILTFKPAVETAWQDDISRHIDFEGWQFVCPGGKTYEECDKSKPIVCFGSFQDYLGVDDAGGIKAKNKWVHETPWDLVVFDEYHFGAWRENAKKLFEKQDEDDYESVDIEEYQAKEAGNAQNETWLPISTDYYLFLSGTPFRALHNGEFIEDQIYSWTYSDEQRAKAAWGNQPDNPYAALPRMILMTYQMPDSIKKIALQGQFNEFDLNVFFSAEGKGDAAHFVFEDYVQKWLDLIRGAYLPGTLDDLKLGNNKKPAMPYSDTRLLNVLSHTLWFLPNVASCFAMKNLLMQSQNAFYHDYAVNVCAGTQAGIGPDALGPVEESFGDPLKTKTITLSCGKLTTGVTVKPWTGIFMLRNLSSPETYFQAAFRVQSPWVVNLDDSGHKQIMKENCYIFDFALDRALKEVQEYSCGLDIGESNPEKKVGEFIQFLPVIACDGSSMIPVDASQILDITTSGTTATLLARRWESALLVNVDNDTLSRLMANPEAMAALMKIEGFRSLNKDIETIINKSDAVKKAKKDGNDKTDKEKKKLTEEEKEYKSKRKEIQEKLIKFATRVPIFMYLTDFREHSLKDVITQLEPNLFKKVTGLDVKDFDLLVSLGLFNQQVMNDAVYKFRRYEDSSLSYTGIDRHVGQSVGLYDTVLSREDYEKLAASQQSSTIAKPHDPKDVPSFEDIVKTFGEETEDEAEDDDDTSIIERPKTDASLGILPRDPIVPLPPEKPQTAETNTYKPLENSSFDGAKVGDKVVHAKFGEGVIVAISGGLAVVDFGNGRTKRFEYPNGFIKGFLTLK